MDKTDVYKEPYRFISGEISNLNWLLVEAMKYESEHNILLHKLLKIYFYFKAKNIIKKIDSVIKDYIL